MTLPSEPQTLSSKEKKGLLPRITPEKEKYPVVERAKVPEIPEGIKKVEVVAGEEISLPQPVTDDTGAVILDDATPKNVTITLPLTEEEIQNALRLKVVESFRWLAEWTKRLLKKARGKFVYRLTSTRF